MDYSKLFHEEKAFQRETFQERMDLYGFKNMGRMELFLWDLELFLQIQNILGDKIVLKGGAATQFYLPEEVQRTSVDIDMIFCGSEQEITDTLNRITTTLGSKENSFIFRKHTPRQPKTNLPMHTYYVDVPSVLSNTERNTSEDLPAIQELKIEFIMEPEKWEFQKKTGEKIFAVESKWGFQILPLSHLFADKLTTMGSRTIGVQDDRMDEQVKQFYDIMMLTKYQLSELDVTSVREKYIKRAEKEWYDRTKDMPYDLSVIVADVRKQLLRYCMADSGDDPVLKKYINDFHSLYLNSIVDYSPQTVACGAALIHLMYELMIEGKEWRKIQQALNIEKKLELENLQGKEKGKAIKELRDLLIQEFGSYSAIDPKILKGKNLKRIFWAIAELDNLDEIENVITKERT